MDNEIFQERLRELDKRIEEANEEMNLLDACKLAYRKHVLDDDSIGWDELGNCLLDALCNELGDDDYQEWLKSIRGDSPR